MTEVADLLLMQQKLRDCRSIVELGHLVANETKSIFDYQSALLWLHVGGHTELSAVSGIPQPVKHTPFYDWANEAFSELQSQSVSGAVLVNLGEVNNDIAARWSEYLPEHAIWIPLEPGGALLLARDTPWTEEEREIAGYWAGAIRHAVNALARQDFGFRNFLLKQRQLLIIAAVVAIFSFLIPIEQSVTADAEIVARNPSHVRSPIDGIVGDVLVEPNEVVKTGQLLLTLDDRNITTQLNVVTQELEITKAEYRKAIQGAISDQRAAMQLAVLRSRIEQREIEQSYVQSLLERTEIRAESAGIAIVSDASDLEGKPVKIGQDLLKIASPGSVEVEFWLAVEDSISLTENARATLFPNVEPDNTYQAQVRYINFQAEVSPQGIFGFRGRAHLLSEKSLPRLGWRGSLTIYGERVSLAYFLLRRPIAQLRVWTGL
jgi:hypothetical protein